ncbi:Alkaline phosphatase/alkaline phosphatase D OS=Streptomyces violarus OX=67380 GN=FHS41_007306 PE=4 SV=1 [Streptomyces violarus]
MTPAAHPSQHAPELRTAAPHIGRRRFLTATGAAAALAFSTNRPAPGVTAAAELDAARITDNPFTLGVASGDPLPDSVILWTRLAPAPFQADSGLPAERVTVHWELANDERFPLVARRGTATAHPEYPHTVHVDVGHWTPDATTTTGSGWARWISPVGRTRTAAGRGQPRPGQLTLAAVACQAYHDGYYTAIAHLAAGRRRRRLPPRRLPVRVRRWTPAGGDAPLHRPQAARRVQPRDHHAGGLPAALRPLQERPGPAAPRTPRHPFVVTWDDHETENNYAGAIDEKGGPA